LDQVRESISAGARAEGEGKLAEAEQQFQKAVELGRRLPHQYSKDLSDALGSLAFFYQRHRKDAPVSALLEERVRVLSTGQDPPQPELGIALFDLQSFFVAGQNLQRALEVANRATEFYSGPCMASLPAQTCNRRLADVEGMMGAGYYLAGRFDEAEPWLKKVTDRPDPNVRPETMLTALRAYSIVLKARNDSSAAQVYRRALRFAEAYPEAAKQLDRWSVEHEPPPGP